MEVAKKIRPGRPGKNGVIKTEVVRTRLDVMVLSRLRRRLRKGETLAERIRRLVEADVA